MTDQPVTLAAIIGAHGVTGEVRLKLFGAGIESLRPHKSFIVEGRTLTLKALRPDKAGAVARFAEISDRTTAESLRGTLLSVPRASLPPLGAGEFYYADLIGQPVLTLEGGEVGHVVAVENFGAGEILEIAQPDGSRFMVPVRPEAVPDLGPPIRLHPDFLP